MGEILTLGFVVGGMWSIQGVKFASIVAVRRRQDVDASQDKLKSYKDIRTQLCCDLSYELYQTRLGRYGGEIFPDIMLIAEPFKNVSGDRLYLYVDSDESI